MRMKGRPRQVIHPTTKKKVWSHYPLTREAAMLEGVAFYQPLKRCRVHEETPRVFTLTNVSECCAICGASAAYSMAIGTYGEPRSYAEAINRGMDFYWTPRPNTPCGHIGKVTLNGKCWTCEENKKNKALSPRQIALRKGRAWYMPAYDDPCPRGHVSERRVSNGSCKECEDDKKKKKGPAVAINKICPDMIVSREDARTMGFNVYRTGEPCFHGHRGWRYVSTQGCLDCKNGRAPAKEVTQLCK